jgi:hypothetical protein
MTTRRQQPPQAPASAAAASSSPAAPEAAATPATQGAAPKAAPATPYGGRRRQTLLDQLEDWRTLRDEMRERQANDREMLQVTGKVHEAQDAIHAYDVAAVLHSEADPERRLGVQVREALASRSHVAAGAAERQLQEVRTARLAREQAEAEAAAARVDPAAAVAKVVEQLQSFPDFLRRQIADALGATVHVHSDPPVLAIVPPPDDDGGSHHAQPSGRGLSQGRPRRVIGAP